MFKLLKTDGQTKARLGQLRTVHGVIDTPIFMPVGTQAAVKTLDPRELRELGAQIILSNTYHLCIRPGMEVMEKMGGLHQFMSWPYPILTDSGGYQVFSLARIRKIKPEGVSFRSHLDGTALFLGPKEAMHMQKVLGSDIAMVLDECPPHTSTQRQLHDAVERTIRWAEHCRQQPRADGQLVFGIVQGAGRPELREQCAKALVSIGFDGYAIGGVSVGETEAEMMKAVEYTEPFLPANQARYAMGLGTPAQIVELVARGVDMFDCVLPTRIARNGAAFTRKGTVNIKAAYCKTDPGPIEEGCTCFACRTFSRAYLRHLINVEEILALRMISVHNCHMYVQLMTDIRRHIAQETFAEFRAEFAWTYVPSKNLRANKSIVAE